jgi:hypothetical protein
MELASLEMLVVSPKVTIELQLAGTGALLGAYGR